MTGSIRPVQSLDDALSPARLAARNKDVIVMGGGDVLRQVLEAEIIDEFTLTIAPILLCAGKHFLDGIDPRKRRVRPGWSG